MSTRYESMQAAIAEATALAGRSLGAVQLLAVSKQAAIEQVQALISLGQHHFGENRVEHLMEMHAAVPGVQWHFIGHLQRNKVTDVVRLCSSIDSVDSLRLAEKIELEAAKQDKVIDVLIQLNVSGEAQKTGLHPDQLMPLAQALSAMPHIRLRGLMCMAPRVEDPALTMPIFAACQRYYAQLQTIVDVDTLSMGMSGDFRQAIACGATMVRIGSALFT